MAPILKAFNRYRKEAALIGGIAVAYTELEYDLCMCIAMGINDLDVAIKALFRARGEKQRIEIADALGRKAYRALNLTTVLEETIAAIKYCAKIRNQYAHCNWHDDNSGRLSFLNLEEIAVPNNVIVDLSALTFHYLDAALLEEQTMYFFFVSNNLHYLNFEGRKRAGTISTHAIQAAPLGQRPLLHR